MEQSFGYSQIRPQPVAGNGQHRGGSPKGGFRSQRVVAQIAKDLGALADARRLARAAAHYEGAAVRRLGYLLEQAGHTKQAKGLRVYAETARHFAPLDPGVKPIVAALADVPERDSAWKLLINEVVEVDA